MVNIKTLHLAKVALAHWGGRLKSECRDWRVSHCCGLDERCWVMMGAGPVCWPWGRGHKERKGDALQNQIGTAVTPEVGNARQDNICVWAGWVWSIWGIWVEILIAILIYGSRTEDAFEPWAEIWETALWARKRLVIWCFFRHKKYLHENSLELSG